MGNQSNRPFSPEMILNVPHYCGYPADHCKETKGEKEVKNDCNFGGGILAEMKLPEGLGLNESTFGHRVVFGR